MPTEGAEEGGEAPEPVVLRAGEKWIPLQPALEIVPGSALDFSKMGFHEAPAGKFGRVIAREDGRMAFADQPEVPRRFYGVNLCFGAHYLAADEAERLADRLVRLGYNALRIHHYERDLVAGQASSTELNPERLAQFDHLMAALIRRGIYLTTDLYVSRPVPWREIGMDRSGNVPMNTFKMLVPVHEGAWENWKAFSRALLSNVNPETGRSYAQEPALAWLCMINEGNLGNFFNDLKEFEVWQSAWNRWLQDRYGDFDHLAEAWGGGTPSPSDWNRRIIAFPENLWGRGMPTRDCIAFLSDMEFDMVRRMRRFLREELGCEALISNANSWTNFTTDQKAREIYDYVDDHFYVDHPRFLESPWRLPSRCPNTNPISGGADGGRNRVFTRVYDKPFTISEYNYSAPGKFRGVGGILTGAMGALQDWSAIWRFAYSHSREAMFEPRTMGYFNLASDPLSQASERASLCLFLRGDMQPAPHRVAMAMTTADLNHPADYIPRLAPDWHWAAWITRLGSLVVRDPSKITGYTVLFPLGWQTPCSAYPASAMEPLDPYRLDNSQLMNVLRNRQILAANNITAPEKQVYQSETGSITIDAPHGIMILDTPRTAGGYAPPGNSISSSTGGVSVSIRTAGATVWVSALDDLPIRRSHRLLVSHLTDLQNSEIRYAEPQRRTLLDWGHLPYLVRNGEAQLELRVESPSQCRAWALALDGQRVAPVPTEVHEGVLRLNLEVDQGDAGAGMLYEISRK